MCVNDASLTRCFEYCPGAVYTEGQVPPLFVWLHKPSLEAQTERGTLDDKATMGSTGGGVCCQAT